MPHIHKELPRHTVRRDALRHALARILSDDAAGLVLLEGSILGPHADGFARAVLREKSNLGAQVLGASLALPRYLPGSRIPFVPLPDGGDTFYARPDQTSAMLFWPEAAEMLLSQWGSGHEEGLAGALARLNGYCIMPCVPVACEALPCPDECSQLLQGELDWRLAPLADAIAVYDERWEIAETQARALLGMDVPGTLTIDLWGKTAEQPQSDYLLSSRPCSDPMAQFAFELVPPEANLGSAQEGGLFSLGRWQAFGAMTEEAKSIMYRISVRHNAFDDYIVQFLGPLRKIKEAFGR